MQIQYYGASCFKITTKPKGRNSKEITLFLDPFVEEYGLRAVFGQADIALYSLFPKKDTWKTSGFKGGVLSIDMPGEYSAEDVKIIGMKSYSREKKATTTAFLIESEDIKVAHLGFSGEELSEEIRENISGADILFLPIGGNEVFNAKEAEKTVQALEPSIIIPMIYALPQMKGNFEEVSAFCKEFGACPEEQLSKFTYKKEEGEGGQKEVVLLESLR